MARPPVHGKTDSPAWRSWKAMLGRCYTPGTNDYDRYGGRGITVCDRWRGPKGFVNFFADMGDRPVGMQIDRKDSNGNYSPDNCKWSTPKQQQRNRCSNRLVEYQGQSITVTELSERTGVHLDTLRARLDAGWSVDRAAHQTVLRPKLTASDASELRAARALGLQYSELATMFGIGKSQAFRICRKID